VADHQGLDLVMVLRVNPEKAAAFGSEAPLVEAGHVEVNPEVVDSKLGLRIVVHLVVFSVNTSSLMFMVYKQ